MKLPYKGAGILFLCETPQGKEILLGKRKYSPKGVWSIPGGGMDRQDKGSFLQCAVRETREELGKHPIVEQELEAWLQKEATGEKIPSFSIPLIAFQWKTFYVYLPEKPNDWPKYFHEFFEVSWFALDALPQKTYFGVHLALLFIEPENSR
ncbi:MAG: NUDIX hydrolase [Candidatus Hydrogenedentota bacterium]|nr:MAG: NUDIX hydrolase [Candidatus Hydrogenedentota bacterium]